PAREAAARRRLERGTPGHGPALRRAARGRPRRRHPPGRERARLPPVHGPALGRRQGPGPEAAERRRHRHDGLLPRAPGPPTRLRRQGRPLPGQRPPRHPGAQPPHRTHHPRRAPAARRRGADPEPRLNSLGKRLQARFPRGSFARNVGVLAGGAALGQGITLLAAPLLSRLYSPDDFGLLAVYASLLGILSVAANLRYELAIPLPEGDEEAAQVLGLSLAVTVVVSLLAALVVWALGERLLGLIGSPALRPYLW